MYRSTSASTGNPTGATTVETELDRYTILAESKRKM